MRKQNYANHVRYYTAHHFVFYPLLLIALILSWNAYNHHPDQKEEWGAIFIIFLFIGWSSFMLRQHYGLGNQNRIIRLELRFRYFRLTGKNFEPLDSRLQFPPLAALRFAPDEEIVALAERAVNENLSATQIKKSIRNWLPDLMRL